MGDRLSPGALISRMRQAYFTFLGLTLLLAVPAAALTYMRLFARRVLPNLTDNLLYAALAALTATLSALVLAQIYARRVRGCDLGATQQESVADVFA
jgi:hypothetical protein